MVGDIVEAVEPAVEVVDDPFAWFDRHRDTYSANVRIVQCWVTRQDNGQGEDRYFAVADWATPQAAIAWETSPYGYEREADARSAALERNNIRPGLITL